MEGKDEQYYAEMRHIRDVRHLAHMVKTFRYEHRKFHFLGWIYDGDTCLMVCKYYGVRYKWWHYDVFELDNWVARYIHGLITDVKKDSKSPVYSKNFKP